MYIIDRQSYFIPSELMKGMILTFLGLNLFLAFFNLLPIHPLDGGKVIAEAGSFVELEARLDQLGSNSPDVLVVEAAAEYPKFATILM